MRNNMYVYISSDYYYMVPSPLWVRIPWIISCEEAIELAYGTSVVLLRCPFVPEIMNARAPEVFLHQ
jgi:hypothetical protein